MSAPTPGLKVAPTVPSWKLTLEYDGRAFCGWQRQAQGASVQQAIEEGLERLHKGEALRVTAAGRTDAGVHARGQVVSFTTRMDLPAKAYERGLNTMLPRSVAVVCAERVPEAFDARRWAHGKRYVYRVLNDRVPHPLRSAQTWLVPRPLDVNAMREAAQAFVGVHDFSAFRAADCQAKTTVRRIRRVDVEQRGDEFWLTFEATAFLRHMVRNLVGTLVEVGEGKRRASDTEALLVGRDRRKAGCTAPPEGLCLDEVFYDLEVGPPNDDAHRMTDD